MRVIRCAIYTRKSSEEGLEQDFNSLHAQREACAAYVMSQAGEGWSLIDTAYDDGGISGGTLERPGLQRLLADIAAKQIDIVVVYKVDRLTRSLLDFSKLVEAFDAAGTSFVSVTQSFNTTTSMGRLTLNMLLSFAQFEREVTAERIRDKIAASKAKGMWMGGVPPLGYEPDGRTLRIVEEHAILVRDIFQRYLDTGNVRTVAEQLSQERIVTPMRTRRNGSTFGGVTFTRGQLYAILTSPIYIGEIRHKDKIYPGQHPALLERALWDQVQARLADNVRGTRTVRRASPSLLAGKIVDEASEPLVASHARKGKVGYRYYTSRSLQHDAGAGGEGNGLRIPAREIEGLVTSEVGKLFADPFALAARLGANIAPHRINALQDACASVGQQLAERKPEVLSDLLTGVRVLAERVEIEVDPLAMGRAICLDVPQDRQPMTLTTAVRLTRTGRMIQLVQDDGCVAAPAQVDAKLVRLIISARRWWGILLKGEETIDQLARREGVSPSWITRVVRLAFLSPALVEAILDGATKAGVDCDALKAPRGVDASWREQEKQYLPT